MVGFKSFLRWLVSRDDKRLAVCFVARRHNVQRLARNITQKEGAGKGFVIGIVPNPFALEQHLADGWLRDAAFGELLQNVFAPLNSSQRNRFAENCEVEWFHLPSVKVPGQNEKVNL